MWPSLLHMGPYIQTKLLKQHFRMINDTNDKPQPNMFESESHMLQNLAKRNMLPSDQFMHFSFTFNHVFTVCTGHVAWICADYMPLEVFIPAAFFQS